MNKKKIFNYNLINKCEKEKETYKENWRGVRKYQVIYYYPSQFGNKIYILVIEKMGKKNCYYSILVCKQNLFIYLLKKKLKEREDSIIVLSFGFKWMKRSTQLSEK